MNRSELRDLIAQMCEYAEDHYREVLRDREDGNEEVFIYFSVFSAVVANLILAQPDAEGIEIRDEQPYDCLRMWERMDLIDRKKLINLLFEDCRLEPSLEATFNELLRLRAHLHARESHPDWEYACTRGPVKGFDEKPPEGEGWIRNVFKGTQGWARFEYYEEAYWTRPKKGVINVG